MENKSYFENGFDLEKLRLKINKRVYVVNSEILVLKYV